MVWMVVIVGDWILDTGYWMLDAGSSIWDFGFRNAE